MFEFFASSITEWKKPTETGQDHLGKCDISEIRCDTSWKYPGTTIIS